MAKIWLAPTGKISTGNVLDVAKGPFLQALKDHDSQLYIKWNPNKLRGWGCWEIRRLPNTKSAVEVVEFEGNTYTRVEYKENNLVHHVLDCAFLNYDQLRKIKQMDTWQYGQGKGFVDALETREKEYVARKRQEAVEARKYAAKQFKREINDFKEMVQSGLNPAVIQQYWNNKGK